MLLSFLPRDLCELTCHLASVHELTHTLTPTQHNTFVSSPRTLLSHMHRTCALTGCSLTSPVRMRLSAMLALAALVASTSAQVRLACALRACGLAAAYTDTVGLTDSVDFDHCHSCGSPWPPSPPGGVSDKSPTAARSVVIFRGSCNLSSSPRAASLLARSGDVYSMLQLLFIMLVCAGGDQTHDNTFLQCPA
jgi:hypothetical protein